MLRKPITFENFDGEIVTEEFWFNLNASELVTLSFVNEDEGGLEALIQEAIKTKNVSKIIAMYTEIVEAAYGVRSEDGKRFVKNPTLFEEFKQTPAFDTLIMELCMDEKAGTDFMLGIVPSRLKEGALQRQANPSQAVELPVPDEDPEPWLTENRNPTKSELKTMNKDQLQRAMRAKQERLAAVPDAEAEALRQQLLED